MLLLELLCKFSFTLIDDKISILIFGFVWFYVNDDMILIWIDDMIFMLIDDKILIWIANRNSNQDRKWTIMLR